MSRLIDVSKPLSAEDRDYLVQRDDQYRLELNAQLTGSNTKSAQQELPLGEDKADAEVAPAKSDK
jgi:hypothetical protein